MRCSRRKFVRWAENHVVSQAHGCTHLYSSRAMSVIAGGFEQFRQTYPHLCSTRDNDDDDDDDEDRHSAPCAELSRLSLHSTTNKDDAKQLPEDCASLRELIISSPPTLIAPYLYIGNAQNALDIDCLRTNGIQYIVNVTNNVPNRSVTIWRELRYYCRR